ncbi:MAG: NTP transferase domain-containing protein [Treponema sp.]|jgi:spore coat polysaccharide biosynthesis protein SpsF|nr:NTP transferase domain-containing protein [Treponema sp.]
MTAIILQARLDSSRLPGKVLLPLGGRPLLFRVMEALNRVPSDLWVLACPEDCIDAFTPLAGEAGFEIIAGPKEDVLERYCIAIRNFHIDRVIRATGDNPFVFPDAAIAINDESASRNADYAGYSGLPPGAGVESISAAALLRAEKEASALPEREHVCPYLYGHPELFSLHRPLAPLPWQDSSIRLTVDTAADYERACSLYEALSFSGDSDARYRGEAIIAAWSGLFLQDRR